MGFDASSVVEPLDWDFTKYAGPTAKGTIPEPSDAKIETFLREVKELARSNEAMLPGLSAIEDPKEMLDALDQFETSVITTTMAGLAEAYAKLCANQPNKTQITKLPLRVRMAFFSWIAGEVVRPEGVTNAGKKGALVLPRAAGA